MAYSKVSYGSKGSDVSTLQKKLNENGYHLSVDGVFGTETQKAVRDYQQKNNLAVDGVAGSETWGSLTKAATPTASAKKDYTYNAAGDKAYQEALQALREAQGQTPTYSASYDEQMNELFQKIMNREKFSYDPNSDQIYQQYRGLYTQQGQQAMMDTMGQAAGLTGGYGSTYGQNAGQQAYNAYLQQLNNVVPELYSAAADRYAAEGNDMAEQYAMLGDLRDTEYGRYKDQLNEYWQNLQYLTDRADTAYSQGADNWWNALQLQKADEELAYQKERDKIADEQWERQFAASQAARYSGGSSGGNEGKNENQSNLTFAKSAMDGRGVQMIAVNARQIAQTQGAAAAVEFIDKYAAQMTEKQYIDLLEDMEAWYGGE